LRVNVGHDESDSVVLTVTQSLLKLKGQPPVGGFGWPS